MLGANREVVSSNWKTPCQITGNDDGKRVIIKLKDYTQSKFRKCVIDEADGLVYFIDCEDALDDYYTVSQVESWMTVEEFDEILKNVQHNP